MITAFSTQVSATENVSNAFTYKVVLPENQHDKNSNYFDLRMTPSQKQTVLIKMNNSSNKEITVDVALNSAKTNTNGVIEYGPSKLEKDNSLKFDFAEIVKGEKSVKIPPKQTVEYPLTITMPDSQYDGLISGGIYMIQKDQTKDQKAMIKNEFGYLVGMILSETDTEVKSELNFNKAYAEQQNYRNAIFINYSNIRPVYIDDMSINVQIMKKGSEEVLYDTRQTKMRMAPNSQINFPVLMNGEKMIAGDYSAHIVVTTENNGKWEWLEDFTITDEEADKFNKEDVSLLQESRIDWRMIIFVVVGVFVVITIIFFAVRLYYAKRQKEKKRQAVEKKKKKAKKNGK
nr:DUF916 and DUF3324 domain-containing protein [Enterococcus sp. 9D6_DIV0238]OUZ34615.1 hypothetical protein A5889_000090 [Enterococcus sp. 9D6_DIV0238]